MNRSVGRSMAVAAAIWAVEGAGPSAAAVLFDNGGASVPGSGGPLLVNWTPVDDFTLSGAARITGGTFDANGVPTSDFGGLQFLIYADQVSGPYHKPAALLATGVATVTATTYLGTPGYVPHTRATFSFDAPFLAEAGVRYWFGLHQTASEGVGWTVRDFGPSVVWEHYRFDDPGIFRRNDFERAFSLTGTTVPEPAAWALMLAGFGLAGAALRRRRPAPT